MLSQGDSHSSSELHGASAERIKVQGWRSCVSSLLREGIQLLEESWGMVACITAQRIYQDEASLMHTSILKKQRCSGFTNPMVQVCHPAKIPGVAEEFPGSRGVTFIDPLCSSRSLKGLQQQQNMDSDLIWRNHPKIRRGPAPQQNNVAASVLLRDQ